MFNESRVSESKLQFKFLSALNVYKINPYQQLNFMSRLQNRLHTWYTQWHHKKARAKITYKIFELKLNLKKIILLQIVDFKFLSGDQNCEMKSSNKRKKNY